MSIQSNVFSNRNRKKTVTSVLWLLLWLLCYYDGVRNITCTNHYPFPNVTSSSEPVHTAKSIDCIYTVFKESISFYHDCKTDITPLV